MAGVSSMPARSAPDGSEEKHMADGLRDEGPLHDWRSLDEDQLRSYAATYVGWATSEMADPSDLRRTLEDVPLDLFEAVHVDWDEWYRDEVVPNPRCAWMTGDTGFHSPVVISVEGAEPIIWDGWHRIAYAIAAGRGTISAVVGREA